MESTLTSEQIDVKEITRQKNNNHYIEYYVHNEKTNHRPRYELFIIKNFSCVGGRRFQN